LEETVVFIARLYTLEDGKATSKIGQAAA